MNTTVTELAPITIIEPLHSAPQRRTRLNTSGALQVVIGVLAPTLFLLLLLAAALVVVPIALTVGLAALLVGHIRDRESNKSRATRRASSDSVSGAGSAPITIRRHNRDATTAQKQG